MHFTALGAGGESTRSAKPRTERCDSMCVSIACALLRHALLGEDFHFVTRSQTVNTAPALAGMSRHEQATKWRPFPQSSRQVHGRATQHARRPPTQKRRSNAHRLDFLLCHSGGGVQFVASRVSLRPSLAALPPLLGCREVY